MATVTRDSCGIHLDNSALVDKETQFAAIYAIGRYGFLLAQGETISVRTWIARIKAHHAHSAELLSMCACLLEVDKPQEN